jgi:multidrug efflux pump subunit AcrA (membrane-fusion protein)
VQLQTEQQRLLSDQADLAKQKLALARLLGLHLGTEITLEERLSPNPALLQPIDDIIAHGIARRSNLKSDEAFLHAAEQALKAAHSEHLPNVSASAYYGIQGVSPANGGNGVFAATGSVNVPIWQGGRIESDVQQAQAVLEQAHGQVAVADDTHESARLSNSDSPSNEQAPTEPPQRRRRLLIPIVVLLIAIVGVSTWWLMARNYEDTDNAQVDGHLNPISSRISGTILAVHVDDNQSVQAGQPLIELDPKDYLVDQAQAKADHDQALADSTAERPSLPITITGNTTDEATGRAEVTNAEAALAAAQHDHDNALAKLRSSEATNARAQSDLQRYTELIRKQEVAQSDYDQFEATAKAQSATVEADKAAVLSASKTIEQRRALLLEEQSKLDQTLKNATKQIRSARQRSSRVRQSPSLRQPSLTGQA